MKQQLYIAGEWVDGSEETELFAPYSGERIAMVAVASWQQADQAVEAAMQAKLVMRNLSAHARSVILEKVSCLLSERRNEAAKLIALEAAKPIKAAYLEIDRTVTTFKLAAEEARRISGDMIPMDGVPGGEGRLAFTKKEPVGVIAAITPFNFPMNLVAHKLGPAFAAGNCVVLKPAEQTPLSAYYIAELFHEAGLPAGALNVITGIGKEIGEYIVKDERVSFISFTGSKAVGEQVRRNARLKRVTLELGSNSAVIIDSDADLEKAAIRCVTGAFSNQGQVCISLQRIYVVEEAYERFLNYFLLYAKELITGDPLHQQTDVSIMINTAATDRAIKWIEEALQLGAQLVLGGSLETLALTGSSTKQQLLPPTVLTHVPEQSKLIQEEVFAPIVSINRVKSVKCAIDLVNSSTYGLQAGIYTNQLETALAAADELEVGGVLINDIPTYRLDHMPYGGRKDSGIGREGIKYAAEDMCETKLVIINRN